MDECNGLNLNYWCNFEWIFGTELCNEFCMVFLFGLNLLCTEHGELFESCNWNTKKFLCTLNLNIMN